MSSTEVKTGTMHAISIKPGIKEVNCIEHPQPFIERPTQVKLEVLEVGICGTDRELVSGERARAPRGEDYLILGHEMLGEVVEVGKAVTTFKVGDLAVVTVRRGCNHCLSCLVDRPDMCYEEDYQERGIKSRHGFQSNFVVDDEKFLVKVHKDLASFGVLCEPMSIVEKAIDQILLCQKARLPFWESAEDLNNKQALVVGLGPIGLLACMVLRLRGLKVYGQDIVSEDSPKAKIVEELGGVYIDGKKDKYDQIPHVYGPMDLIVEAAGVAELDFNMLDALRINGGCVLTGIPNPEATFPVKGGLIMERLVLQNQLILGSVNASKHHWELAIADLHSIHEKWPQILSKIITCRAPYQQYRDLLLKSSEGEIKCVLQWNERTKA